MIVPVVIQIKYIWRITGTKLLEPMTKGHVSPAILNKNRLVIFQFEPIKKDQFQFSYEKSPLTRLSNYVVLRKNAVLRFPKVFVKTSAGMFTVGEMVNVTFFCSTNSRRKSSFMAN